MKKIILLLAVVAGLCFFLYEFSSGHGGQYRGPGDTVPPNLGGPGDTTPPSNPGGPATPGPAGPSTAGPKGPGTAGPGTLGPRGSTTGGLGRKRTVAGEGYERWEFWWEQNKESFLNLRNRLSKGSNVSGSSGWLIGRGKKSEASNSKRPSLNTIKNEVLPSLKNALSSDNADILDSAVLALARIIRSENADLVFEDILGLVGSTHQTAQESATLSLGVLGAEAAVEPLRQLMIDSSEGKKLVGRGSVPKVVRSFAALSLGLINSPDCVDHLFQVIDMEQDKERNLKSCAITALGLMKNNDRHEEIVNKLITLMSDKKMDPFVQSNAPTALGKLGDPIALDKIVNTFKLPKLKDYMLQSCAIGMGQLASIDDTEVIDLLIKYIGSGKNDQARHFSFIALGQIGARDKETEKNKAHHDKLANFLLKEIVKPGKITHLPWACLAAAIHAQKHEDYQGDVIEKIFEMYKKNKSPSYRGAISISLGLLNAKSKANYLFEELKRVNDPPLKGYLAVSLGLMSHKLAADVIREIARTEVRSFRLRLQAATSLGLMGDAEAVDVLVDALKKGKTLTITSSAAQALGRIGDVSAIPPLRDILNKKGNPLARAFAAVALGIIGEKTDLPWNAVISENYNYRAKTDAISEILDIL